MFEQQEKAGPQESACDKTVVTPCAPPSDDEQIDIVAEQILERHLAAFEELAR